MKHNISLVCPYCGYTHYTLRCDSVSMLDTYICNGCGKEFIEPIEWDDYRNVVTIKYPTVTEIETIGEHYAEKLRSAADDLQYCAYDSQSLNLVHKLKVICDIVAEYIEKKS